MSDWIFLQLGGFALQRGGQFLVGGGKLFDLFHDDEGLLFDLGLVGLLGVDLQEEGLVLAIVFGGLLLLAEPLDVIVAGLEVQVELAGLGLLAAQGGRGSLECFGGGGDAAFLKPHVAAGIVQKLLSGTDLLVGLI
jgi:hypothetical protein